MKTISASELKRVKAGIPLTVVDHNKPVATLSAVDKECLLVREAMEKYQTEALTPLISINPDSLLNQERADSW
jgi:antitoxin (DNA-binding transcriptional repressor) of toxin-antitoxin stability system